MWSEQNTCQECGTLTQGNLLRCSKCNHLISVSPIEGPARSEIILTSMWSLKDFLPEYTNPISLHEGNTPLIQIKNLTKLRDLSLKL